MKFLSVDLELNKPSRKIIQIGAAIGDIESGKIISDFSVYVNPNEKIHSFITELTGITDNHVSHGQPLDKAYQMLVDYAKSTPHFINPVVWGADDMQILYKQIFGADEIDEDYHWPFGYRTIDVKTLYVSYCLNKGIPVKGGLKKSMHKMGLQFDGTAHDACNDASNTLKMFFKMQSLYQ